jgi:hypothetical protein
MSAVGGGQRARQRLQFRGERNRIVISVLEALAKHRSLLA